MKPSPRRSERTSAGTTSSRSRGASATAATSGSGTARGALRREHEAAWTPNANLRRLGAEYWSALVAGRPFDIDDAIYLDLEGRVAISLFIPSRAPSGIAKAPSRGADPRYALIRRRSGTGKLDADDLRNVEQALGRSHKEVQTVVVFSTTKLGQRRTEELRIVDKIFGRRMFPKAREIDLHAPYTKPSLAPTFKEHIRQHHCYTRVKGNAPTKKAQYALEPTERAFGLDRPIDLRSHSYVDDRGTVGTMRILETEREVHEQKVHKRNAPSAAEQAFIDYCRWDVWSMHQICLRAERCAHL